MNAVSPQLTKKYDGTFKMVEKTFDEIKKLIRPYVEDHKKSFSQGKPKCYSDFGKVKR